MEGRLHLGRVNGSPIAERVDSLPIAETVDLRLHFPCTNPLTSAQLLGSHDCPSRCCGAADRNAAQITDASATACAASAPAATRQPAPALAAGRLSPGPGPETGHHLERLLGLGWALETRHHAIGPKKLKTRTRKMAKKI
jgi:hypothetical protein